MGHQEGAGQSIERLDTYVTELDVAAREIKTTRVFNAPRELVFKVWTDPTHIAKWWGPNGFTNTISEMDVRPGGWWKFVMHGPDGVDYRNESVYVEVVPPERLVFEHNSSPHFRTTVTFEAQGDKTVLTMQMLFPTAEVRDRTVRVHGAEEGNRQTLSRLAEYLAQQ
jgi:uncharacterized protein YndB with AHSA1/START domain